MKKFFGANATSRRFILLIFDIICFLFVWGAYYLLATVANEGAQIYRPDGSGIKNYLINDSVQLALVFTARFLSGIYDNIWRYCSTKAYLKLMFSDLCAGLLTVVIARISQLYNGIWQPLLIGSTVLMITLFSRFLYAFLYSRAERRTSNILLTPCAVVGAGQIGTFTVQKLSNNFSLGLNPKFFIDNDPQKIGNRIESIPILSPEAGMEAIDKLYIKKVILCVDNREKLSSLYNEYTAFGCEVQIPDFLENKQGNDLSIRKLSIEDLLFREQITVLDDETKLYYKDKVVLVTGGGGSIGSEICRQVAKCKPKQIIIFDIYENNAYEIQQELLREYKGKLDLKVLIGSVRDRERVEEVFAKYEPGVVFHAAAHKHVPLMEESRAEAVKNNIIGTYNIADMAEKYCANKFILISTDKAVNPTNIMGASKRMCEMVVMCRKDSQTSFSAVRFGNVLGSNGSVIPLFNRQIEEGGPLTITDKRIIRYFMTIPEASQLVMTAGAMAKKGELFVLDMGRPIKIIELAESLIRLKGLEPYKDIQIKEVGLRPGEKLYEELLIENEALEKTDNHLIFIEKEEPLTRAEVDEKIEILKSSLSNTHSVKKALRQVVPTYKNPDEVNAQAAKSREMKSAK